MSSAKITSGLFRRLQQMLTFFLFNLQTTAWTLTSRLLPPPGLCHPLTAAGQSEASTLNLRPLEMGNPFSSLSVSRWTSV